ncbi:MAG TPA: hypothetical protein VFP31_13665 [Gaiellaceae bacterium]|nr:hypothetical protein [Gaiellaceae bacterium]
MKLPLAPAAVFDVVRELRDSTKKEKPIVLGGARELVDALRRELLRDGDPRAVRDAGLGALDGAAALVYVLAGEPTEEDERALRAADMANVPIIVLGPEPTTPVPYALATDVLPLRPGEGFPLEELGRLLVAKADDAAGPLAAKLPALRRGVAEALVAKVARQNGLIGAAVFIPGVDFPILTLNQLRLVMRLATAYGQQLDAERLPEVLGVVGTGLGLRAIARGALGVVPVAGWAVKGGVAYGGTRALGEAAIRYFEARSGSGGGGAQPVAPGADRA